ncbi:MAG: METTL5 family protein [Methanomassiliicoccaceae archaeon]|jgi:putative methylase|nr:METTL5 family protein [Methanomassiliicoccaceae archaeon]
MKKKDLEIRLQKVKNFIDPDPSLEQYMTPSVIASDILFTAYSEGDINGMDVVDLGCGTGMFSIGAWMLGAASVKGYDISENAVKVARENAAAFGADVDLKVCDIADVTERGDTAVMNPPFGCQSRNADRPFLNKAMDLCDNVYSLHIGRTAEFLDEYVRSRGREICFQKSYKFNIPHTFSFHSKAKQNVDVIMIIIR